MRLGCWRPPRAPPRAPPRLGCAGRLAGLAALSTRSGSLRLQKQPLTDHSRPDHMDSSADLHFARFSLDRHVGHEAARCRSGRRGLGRGRCGLGLLLFYLHSGLVSSVLAHLGRNLRHNSNLGSGRQSRSVDDSATTVRKLVDRSLPEARVRVKVAIFY